MIIEPITLRPDATVREALDLMAHYQISGRADHRRRRHSWSAS